MASTWHQLSTKPKAMWEQGPLITRRQFRVATAIPGQQPKLSPVVCSVLTRHRMQTMFVVAPLWRLLLQLLSLIDASGSCQIAIAKNEYLCQHILCSRCDTSSSRRGWCPQWGEGCTGQQPCLLLTWRPAGAKRQ